ncbi:MAG: hypothetical protein K6G42_10490 [Lachnospiraceae bacterium]|nr:hypothetical protein [Lachnospiraceae bacterium]
MDVRNCTECGTIFQYPGFGSVLCPVCRKKDEEEFTKVKAFLNENPGATLQVVCDATEVSTKKIIKWLKEERLVSKDASGLGLKCERCGASICYGRLCADCKRDIAMEYGLNRKKAPDDSGESKPLEFSIKDQKMRFLNRKK